MKISNLFEGFLILLAQIAFWIFALFLGCVLVIGIVYPLAFQAGEWLKNGVAPPRDGFWLHALYSCGEATCRQDTISPTDWVGVNSIINWVMTLHVAAYSTLLIWVGFHIGLAWADSIRAWKFREAWLRAPTPPSDDEEF